MRLTPPSPIHRPPWHRTLRLILLPLLLYIVTSTLSAQVNTEKLRRADSSSGMFFNTSLRFGLVRGNSEYVSAGAAARVDYAQATHDNFAVIEYEFKESSGGKIANKGFVHLRTIRAWTTLLSVEAFAQAEFNEFLSLKNRDLLGAGARLHLIEVTGAKRSLFSLYLGVGAMFEHEYYATEPAETRFNRVRSTNYLTAAWNPSGNMAASLVGYIQPLIEEPADYRMTAEASLEFTISSRFRFHVGVNSRFHSRPVLNVKRYDFEINNGIRFSLP
ncbi:MAG: DUF481 domain-containing protein [Bacteroidetes bacterium]|nr:DUF481 domain-containing protein [Bacteroidota bacterium]